MICNLHTHTWRCKHATGEERSYVENAIQGGLKVLGFSDHTPMPYPGDYVSPSKMDLDQLEGYCDAVLSLRKEYQDDIEIPLGLEVEYYPALFDSLLDFLGDYPFDYFLLGQHFLGNEIGEPFCGDPSDDPQGLTRYVDQCLQALDTGRFTYLAHPDVYLFTGSREHYQKEMGRLCEGARDRHIPLEINLLGLRTGRHYPTPLFWQVASEKGCPVVIGSDAHQPVHVCQPQTEQKALDMVRELGLSLIQMPELLSPLAPSRR